MTMTMTTIERVRQFYDWGLNCKVLGVTEVHTDAILHEFFPDPEKQMHVDEHDAFWDGFHNGTRPGNHTVPIHVQGIIR